MCINTKKSYFVMINAIKLTLLLILSEISSCIIKLTDYSLRAIY